MLHNAGSEIEGSTISRGISGGETHPDTSSSWLFTEISKQIDKYPMFTPEEERAQLERYAILKLEVNNEDNSFPEEMREIENEFVCRNGKLVLSWFKKQKDYNKYGHSLELLQVSQWALVIALRKFNLEKAGGNKKFSTYAVPAVERAMKRYLQENGNTIRVAVSASTDLKKLNCAREETVVKARCAELGYKKGKTKRMIAAARAMNGVLSLDIDTKSHKGDANNRHEYLSENMDLEAIPKRVENKLLAMEISKKILKYCQTKNLRTFGVYMLKSGILGDAMTLREVAVIFDVSRERIRQISTDDVQTRIESGDILKLDVSDISDKELEQNLVDWCELPFLLYNNLSKEEYKLICLSFGIASINAPCSLSDIAKELETDEEYVEQELTTVLEKLEDTSIYDPLTDKEISLSEYLSNFSK